MKKLFFSFIFFFSLLNAYPSFNIIDRLASPFSYDDESYSSSYSSNYNDYTPPKKGFSKTDIPFLILLLIISLFSPGRYRRRLYYHNSEYYSNNAASSSLASFLGSIFLYFIKKKTETKSFTDDELIKKENEVKEILKNLNMNIEDYKKLAIYTLEQYILMLSGQKNEMSEISTEYLYKKYLKEITELYQKEIKTEIENFSIDDVKIVNIRYTDHEKAISAFIKYTAKQYYIDAINKSFISGERFPIKKCLFLTFVYDGIWKLSLIEQKGESYVIKLENLLGVKSITNNEINFSQKEQPGHKEITISKLQILVAEFFFNIYSWWQNPKTELKVRIDKTISKRIIDIQKKIRNDTNTDLQITKFQIISIDFLSYTKTPANITKGFIARINFLLKGRFVKNSIVLVENEQKLDEIWEFEIQNGEIILKDIIKRLITGSKDIEPSPLQIEWYI